MQAEEGTVGEINDEFHWCSYLASQTVMCSTELDFARGKQGQDRGNVRKGIML